MAKAMTKAQILSQIAETCDMTKKDAAGVIEALVGLVELATSPIHLSRSSKAQFSPEEEQP